MTTDTNPRWNDDLLQFARLLREIAATHTIVDNVLAEAMDLTSDDIEELFDRAHVIWETAKDSDHDVHVIVIGNPVDGIRVVGPVWPNEPTLDEWPGTDETWWYATLKPLERS